MQAVAAKRALIRPGRIHSFVPALLVLVFGVLFIDALAVTVVLSHLFRGQILSDRSDGQPTGANPAW